MTTRLEAGAERPAGVFEGFVVHTHTMAHPSTISCIAATHTLVLLTNDRSHYHNTTHTI
jgi:hypothetical protein